jgi:hypothetical protein
MRSESLFYFKNKPAFNNDPIILPITKWASQCTSYTTGTTTTTTLTFTVRA